MPEQITRVTSVTVTKRVPASVYYPESVLLLMKITANKEFKDGSYTDNVIGYTYECVETIDFQRVKIKIDGQKKPIMTNERLQELRDAGEKVAVEFDNWTLMPFVNRNTKSLDDSHRADDVRLVETNI